MDAPLLWINSFPGSGKHTVAKALAALDETIILIDNHQLIVPVEAKYPRSHPDYEAKQKLQRKLAFDEHVPIRAMKSHVIVFTGMIRISTPIHYTFYS
jgi:predicted ABC-type ATPase